MLQLVAHTHICLLRFLSVLFSYERHVRFRAKKRNNRERMVSATAATSIISHFGRWCRPWVLFKSLPMSFCFVPNVLNAFHAIAWHIFVTIIVLCFLTILQNRQCKSAISREIAKRHCHCVQRQLDRTSSLNVRVREIRSKLSNKASHEWFAHVLLE